MRAPPWNLSTSFAAIGGALAYAALVAAFGVHWQQLPGALCGLIVMYGVSTALGAWALDAHVGSRASTSIIIGVGVALTTLTAGAVAIAVTNFTLETLVEFSRAPSGQPAWNVLVQFAPDYARDFIAGPVAVGLLFGGPPAVLLGATYGILLRARYNELERPAHTSRMPHFSAALGTLLLVAFLLVSVSPIRMNGVQPTNTPVAISACGSIGLPSGVLAYCSGHPCVDGQCRWDIEQDALAVYVLPPAGRGWRWIGGGIGTGRRPDVIRHNMVWARQDRGAFLDDSTPRRFAGYTMRFDGDNIGIGDRGYPFEYGMLIAIQFDDDWTFTSQLEGAASMPGDDSVADLQAVLDRACALSASCEKPFTIRHMAVH